jgi:2-dehydropantoate 2-reductase
LRGLIEECLSIANAKGLIFENDFTEKLIQKIASYPFGARTSMQLDFVTGKKTEVETFTGYVVKSGKELGIQVPHYNSVYEQLKGKK